MNDSVFKYSQQSRVPALYTMQKGKLVIDSSPMGSNYGDQVEDLVAIYCTQLIGGDFPIRANFATLLYQSIVGS